MDSLNLYIDAADVGAPALRLQAEVLRPEGWARDRLRRRDGGAGAAGAAPALPLHAAGAAAAVRLRLLVGSASPRAAGNRMGADRARPLPQCGHGRAGQVAAAGDIGLKPRRARPKLPARRGAGASRDARAEGAGVAER